MHKEIELTPSEYHALLRNDFYTFMVRCFTHLYPSTVFMPNWHLELVATELAECVSGKTRRLIINLPPRHLKSLLASVALPAFYLGHNPAGQIICVSYAQELAEKLARDCRSVMMSAWYKAIFPMTRLSTQRPSVQELITTRARVCRPSESCRSRSASTVSRCARRSRSTKRRGSSPRVTASGSPPLWAGS